MNTRMILATLVACTVFVLVTGTVHAADYTTLPSVAIGQAVPWPADITVPVTDPVTKDNYWTTANHFYTSVRSGAAYWVQQPNPYPNLSYHVDNAMWISRMYAITGSTADADLAAKCIDNAYRAMTQYPTDPNCRPGGETTRCLYLIDKWLTGSTYYTAQHQTWLRNIALTANPSFAVAGGWAKEFGSFNRSFGCALNGECLLALVPTAPDAALWRTYIDTVWNYWWTYKDNDESTDHYNGLWFRYLLQWIEVRNCETEFWASPGVKRMMDRYLYQVTPMGAFAHYGDSCGWNVSWGHWIHIYEACATHYNDPRYKLAAHRMYDYSVNRIQNIDSWGYTGGEAGWSLLNAWSVANDSIGEAPREKEVVLAKRHKIVERTVAEQQATNQWWDLFPELMQDKMIFTSGPSKDSLSLMADVVGAAGHGHNRSPQLIQLTDHQSVLLMALGYMERLHEDHDRAMLMDYDGYPYDTTNYFAKSNNDVVAQANVYELGPVGYGLAKMTGYSGYPANQDRDIVFIKGVGAVVRDAVKFTAVNGAADIALRWGNMYRVANVGPDYGANWINTYVGEWVPLRGIGVNAPVLTRWHNNKRDLLIYFLPNAAGTMELIDRKQWDSTLPLPWQLQYSLRQTVQPNVTTSATTLLLPHASGPAQTLAEGVTTHLDDAQRTVFSFTGEDGALHSVIINHSGAAIDVAGLQTDGQIAYAKRVSGIVTSVALYGGTYLIVNGQNVTTLAAPAKEQVVPESLSDVTVATDPNPPMEADNPITITATPVGGTMVQYQFQVGYDGGNWTTIQGYSSGNTCVWTPLEGHDYTIRVWAKEGDSANQYDVQQDVPYQVTQPQVIGLGQVLATPVAMATGGQWTNALRNAMEPLGYSVGMGTSYMGGNTIGFDTNNTTSTRWDLNAQGEFPTTPTVRNGPTNNQPSWWTLGPGGTKIVAPGYSGHASLCWTTTHYAIPLLDGDTGNLPKSCIITIVPNVAERTTKKIAVLLTNGWNGSPVSATVDYIKIGNFTVDGMFPMNVQHPGGGVSSTAMAHGFEVPVIPGKNIEIKVTLNPGINVGLAFAFEDQLDVQPTVNITTPAPGTIFTAPADVTITADAADSDGTIQKVEFYADGAKLGEDTLAPYSYTWINAPAGAHTLTAVATDNLNLPKTSDPVVITVNDLPVVSLTAPADGAVFVAPSSITLTATATDTVGGIDKVEFYDGANKLGEDTLAPYEYVWNTPTSGAHTLTAKAIDTHTASTTSSAAGITVWGSMDIGNVGLAGSAGYSAPTFTATGAGAGVTSTADAFRFVYQTMTGDCTIVARVATFSSTTSSARAGVMIRQSTAANAKEGSSLFAPSNTRVYFHRRTSAGGNTSTSNSTAAAAPYWVKLVRSGNSFSAYKSSNGATWTQVGNTVTISMTGTIYVGLAVTSGTTSSTRTATFDNVSITAGGSELLKRKKR
ncbi:MAG: Ig-like domain-containing protein [Armatimonadota bacterium]